MGHESERDADLRAGEHRRGGRGLQQPAVGRREEEPGWLSSVYLPSTHYIQGVPYYWARFVFVIFSGSRAHTEELFIAIG